MVDAAKPAGAGDTLPFRPAAAEDGDRAGLAAELVGRGVGFLLPSYVDMHGASKAKMVPIEHFERMMSGSELFTGAALDGVPQDVSEEEVAAHPDPRSCLILPWQPDIAWFASNLMCRGVPFEACSRNILERVRARAAGAGLGMNLGVETEFFVFARGQDGGFSPVSRKVALAKPAYDVLAPCSTTSIGWASSSRR